MREPWLWLATADLASELRQLEDEGRDTSRLREDFERLIALGDDELSMPSNQEKAGALLDAAQRLGTRKGYGFKEPSALPEIRKLRRRGPDRAKRRLSDKALQDRLLGAWLGRCAGCLLGKPVEGVHTDELWGFLKTTGQWPLSDYIRFDVGGKAVKTYPRFAGMRAFDALDHMPADDDLDYTVAGLLIVKERGAAFTPADVARFWMRNIPLLRTYTAERVAYRNLAMQIQPPASASYRNPYREWIGARIRADALGYVCAGDPERAAEFAWRDASVSHVKNGIYGEMLVAAVIAWAPFCDDVTDLLEAGLGEIPETSRLHVDVREVMRWRAAGLGWDEAVARIHERWDEGLPHHWCHTNSNTMICVAALLWGEGEFARSICRAVQPGFDTDCNGATVGSILGMMLGAKRIPSSWTRRLNNTLKTNLIGRETVDIEEIARETFALYRGSEERETQGPH
jgi:ADP-ribosylglycohydrolase